VGPHVFSVTEHICGRGVNKFVPTTKICGAGTLALPIPATG
jgi:hypothetical protein